MTSIDELLAEARAFLDATCPLRNESDEQFVWGEGSDRVNILEEVDPAEASAQLAEAKRYAAARFDAGFGWIDGPVEYGGRGLDARARAGPTRSSRRTTSSRTSRCSPSPSGSSVPRCSRTRRPEVRAAYLPKLYRGDLVMCQLFSEPNAGSDLAAAATRAVRDGDEWVVNGQKVWTSSAHVADLALAVCRTDPDVPKHQGLTTFLVDMHAPGVEVRPLRQMTGTAGFNEVFLTDVRVPDSHRVGDLNEGFRVILTTLGNERTIATRAPSGGSGHRAVRAAPRGRRHLRRPRRPAPATATRAAVHRRPGQAAADRALARVAAPGRDAGAGDVGAEAALVPAQRRAGRACSPRSSARASAADTGEWGSFAWTEYVLSTPGARIGGGTEEIVRNTVGEKVLGLPKEPRA